MASKLDIVEGLAIQHNVTIILLQENHRQTVGKLVINNCDLVGYTISRRQGVAAFVRNNLSWKLSDSSVKDLDMEWRCINVVGYYIINTYKSFPSQMTLTSLPVFDTPCIYAGDFNCQHIDWG